MKRSATIAVILCLQSAAPALQAPPAPTSYFPQKDTFVKSDQAGASYGSGLYLSVEEDPLPVSERLYIRFDIPGLAGKTVTSAKLKLWVIRENGGGGGSDTFEIYGVTAAWNETLTWTQSQALTKTSLISTVPVKDYGATNDVIPSVPEEFDVTPLVQSWAAGSVNEGILMQLGPGGRADMRFGSNESPERPELIVTYGSSAPPPPPPPPPGPPPPPPAPRTSKVGGEDNACGCGTTSPFSASPWLAALAAALILAARRP